MRIDSFCKKKSAFRFTSCHAVFLAYLLYYFQLPFTVSAFSALTLLVGRQEGHPACKKTEWWGAGVVICLEQGADLHMA